MAQELQADLVMDDKDGRKAAELRALTVYGTVGVLVRAAELGLIDLRAMFARLLTTSFRIDERILRDALARDAARKAWPYPPIPRRANVGTVLGQRAPTVMPWSGMLGHPWTVLISVIPCRMVSPSNNVPALVVVMADEVFDGTDGLSPALL